MADEGTIPSTRPQGTLSVIQYMADTGLIPIRPETADDLHFPEIAALQGS